MTILRGATLAALLTGLMSAGAAIFPQALARTPTETSAPTDAQVRELHRADLSSTRSSSRHCMPGLTLSLRTTDLMR